MARFNWAPYQPATYCYGQPQRGTLYVGVFLVEQFPDTYVGNIYACRNIVGGSTLSHHAEGRADDHMTSKFKPPTGISQAQEILELLGPHGDALGIDHMILNLEPWASDRGIPMVYNASHPEGREYLGEHPHKDHNHIGQTRWGAANITLSDIRRIVLGSPPPTPPPPSMEDELLPLIHKPDVVRQDVGLLQERINQTFYPKDSPGLTVDGRYGNGTADAVRKWLVPLTNDSDPEVKAGRKVNFREWNELEIRWHQARGG